jgi:leukotriene-A4 hydrolase
MFDRRNSRGLAATLACAGILAACAPAAVAPAAEPGTAPAAAAMAPLPRDIHSFARPDEARVTHVGVDLRADFASRTLAGTATLDVQTAPGAREIVLDTRDLQIQGVADASGQPLQWALGTADPVLGVPLTVQLPQGTRRIAIRYRTSPQAGALQWLTP